MHDKKIIFSNPCNINVSRKTFESKVTIGRTPPGEFIRFWVQSPGQKHNTGAILIYDHRPGVVKACREHSSAFDMSPVIGAEFIRPALVTVTRTPREDDAPALTINLYETEHTRTHLLSIAHYNINEGNSYAFEQNSPVWSAKTISISATGDHRCDTYVFITDPGNPVIIRAMGLMNTEGNRADATEIHKFDAEYGYSWDYKKSC